MREPHGLRQRCEPVNKAKAIRWKLKGCICTYIGEGPCVLEHTSYLSINSIVSEGLCLELSGELRLYGINLRERF